jgi:hypothetical protein
MLAARTQSVVFYQQARIELTLTNPNLHAGRATEA